MLLEGGFIGLLGGALAALLGVPLGYAAVGALRRVSAFEVDFALPPRYVALTILGSVADRLRGGALPGRAGGARRRRRVGSLRVRGSRYPAGMKRRSVLQAGLSLAAASPLDAPCPEGSLDARRP